MKAKVKFKDLPVKFRDALTKAGITESDIVNPTTNPKIEGMLPNLGFGHAVEVSKTTNGKYHFSEPAKRIIRQDGKDTEEYVNVQRVFIRPRGKSAMIYSAQSQLGIATEEQKIKFGKALDVMGKAILENSDNPEGITYNVIADKGFIVFNK